VWRVELLLYREKDCECDWEVGWRGRRGFWM